MTRVKTTVTLVLTILLAGAVLADAQTRRFSLDDLGRMVRVADPQIAPDAKQIAVIVSRADFENDRWENELVLVDIASGARRTLTNDRRGVSQPRWSPSGDRLAFLALAPTGREMRPQIFVMPLSGGDARALTQAPDGVQQFAWSPDGRTLAFATADEVERKSGPERFNDSFEIENDHFLVTKRETPTHIWLVAAEGGEARRRTSGSWSLPVNRPPGAPASPLSWAPDGKQIAFTKVVSPHSGDNSHRSIAVVDVPSKAIRSLTGKEMFEGYPQFSPDGSRLAYWYSRDGDRANVNEIHLVSAAGSAGRSLTRAVDRNLARSIWMPYGKSLLVGGNDGARVSLWVQPVEGPARRLDLGSLSPSSSFWVDVDVGKDGSIAFTASEPSRPAELYHMASPAAPPKRLTDLNHEVASLQMGKAEGIEWKSDGFTHNGIVTYPPDFDPSRKYPLVLVVHGGPRAASLLSFSSQAHLFAARGWVVFQPNYRGSDNLGNAYQRGIFNDAGEGPGRDVMAGVAALKQRGFVDESRIAVSGWSYGGYMTTWLLGHYGGWKAAVAGAAVTDWLDQYNLGDGNVGVANAFGGSPWTGAYMDAYRAQSPITNVSKIRTPTLVMSNTGDYRVPIMQSFKLYHALKDNGVPTKFIGYPISGHNAGDPVRQRDVQRRWLDWLEQYLKASVTSQ